MTHVLNHSVYLDTYQFITAAVITYMLRPSKFE